MDQQDYLIHELAEKVGISVRTIRYYIAEGLLPSPEPKGRYATFNEEYLMRLELILKLKNAFLPLKEIRDRIAGLDPQQVRDLLDQLEHGNDAQQYAHPAKPASPRLMIRERPLEGALDYLEKEMKAAQGDAKKPEFERNIIPIQPSRPLRRQTGEVENWQRIELAPGLEIHVRSTEEPYYRERIRQIVEFAQIQFS